MIKRSWRCHIQPFLGLIQIDLLLNRVRHTRVPFLRFYLRHPHSAAPAAGRRRQLPHVPHVRALAGAGAPAHGHRPDNDVATGQRGVQVQPGGPRLGRRPFPHVHRAPRGDQPRQRGVQRRRQRGAALGGHGPGVLHVRAVGEVVALERPQIQADRGHGRVQQVAGGVQARVPPPLRRVDPQAHGGPGGEAAGARVRAHQVQDLQGARVAGRAGAHHFVNLKLGPAGIHDDLPRVRRLPTALWMKDCPVE
mmetsp:Transcript_23447/g.38872  ORF Transcript_23447/g.38872 Transcript_23447/m.38872 type:complete len:250 (-) Transcript_23447:290-1039(-)